MKIQLLRGTVLVLGLGTFAMPVLGQIVAPAAYRSSANEICNFSKYRRLIQPHTLYGAAIKRVEPEYPRMGRDVRVSGKVVVRILINKHGDVVSTCVIEGHVLLRAGSVYAAKQWKFKKNFGLTNSRLRIRFAELDLTFVFKRD